MTERHCGKGAADGPQLQQDDLDELSERVGQVSMDTEDGGEFSDDNKVQLPNVIIVTNIHDSVFTDELTRARFEAVFRGFEATASILFLRNFRRARVKYSLPEIAARARIELHEVQICGQHIKCYFAQPREDSDEGRGPHLQPPAPVKQFLISPPASPPVGWEPVTEAEPVINYDLLSAITRLAPGEAHELHPPSASQPGIVVHVCEDPAGFSERPVIVQTRRPNAS